MPGEGSIFQRASDGRWVAALSIGPRSSRTIIRRYARSKAGARAALEEMKGRPTRKATISVGDYLEQWANDVRNIRPTTRDGYEAVVTYHLVPTIGDIRLVDLTPTDVERMLATLEPRMSPKSLRNVHAVLRRALGQAVRADLVERNVASREFVDAPRVRSKDPEALTYDQLEAIIDAASGDRLEALVIVLAETGLRMGEALGLAWQDIRGGALYVEAELVYRDGVYRREDPKSERSVRRVPLTDRAEAAIDAHRQRTIADGYVPTATGPVFTNTTGGPLSGSWFTHHFYDLCEAAGIDRRPPKILRATFSSRLFDAGVPARTIADLMGHAKERTTQRHYISTTPEQAIEAVSRLTLTRHSPTVAEGV